MLTFDPTGQVMSQRWQHGTSTPVTHSYGYDSVQRLVSWYDGTDTTKYTYDQVGNRTLLTGTAGVVPIASYYTSAGPNQLTQTVEIKAGGIVTNYGYDANGAVTGIRRWNTTGAVSSDSLVYSYRGLTEGFLHHEYNGASVTATSEWRYRYSAGGEREQKRLYLQQDSLHNVIEHNSWVYYALGGKKEQLAVYHGQEMAVPGCLPPGPVSVYFYPVEFLTYGNGTAANLVTIPDVGNPAGVKEFHLADHLGSTRVTINTSTGSQYADYGPDGNLLAGGASVREGFIGKELGRENGLLNCGVREKFCGKDGHDGFNRPDPLWEKYRAWSPYVYSQASPISLKDPNGMYVDVRSIQIADAKNGTDYVGTLLKELTRISGLTITVDEHGILQIDASAEMKSGGSETARYILTKMIAESARTSVGMTTNLSTEAMTGVGDNHINFNPDQMSSFYSGTKGLDKMTSGFGMALLHEYLHTKNGGCFSDPADRHYGALGEVEEVVNKVRCELGEESWGQRMSYKGVAIPGYPNYEFIPFTPEASSELANGKVPTGGYVRFAHRAKDGIHNDE